MNGTNVGSHDAQSLGGILSRALRSHQLWLTVGYVTVLFLLAHAQA